MVTDYKIVSSHGISVLCGLVNKLCKEGWIPQGGVNVAIYASTDAIPPRLYSQALIKTT